MEALIYAANFLYLFSYLVKDILHLRLLTIVAACCLVTYFYNQPWPLITVVCWNLFVVGLNVLQLSRILWGRYRAGANDRRKSPESTMYATWSI
jgi:hypothetical protein